MADDPAAQPRPTAWVTGGGALTYARAAATPNADAEDLDPAPQEEEPTADNDDADESEGGACCQVRQLVNGLSQSGLSQNSN